VTQPPDAPYPPQYAGQYPVPPTSGKATAALVLGIVGLVMCGLLAGIPAIILGSQARREIDASQGRLAGRGAAQAGFILGIIGTVLSTLLIVLVIGLFALGGVVSSNFDSSCTTFDSSGMLTDCG
jgi:hypothetical protein